MNINKAMSEASLNSTQLSFFSPLWEKRPVMPNKDAYGFQDKADLQLLFKLELIGWNRSPNYRRKSLDRKGESQRETERDRE